jgi:hypothetical protein
LVIEIQARSLNYLVPVLVPVPPGTVVPVLVAVPAVTVPLMAVSAIGAASAVDPSRLDMEIVVEVVAGESVALTTATTPSVIVVRFNPVSRQEEEPDPDAQVTDLPAPAAAGPAVTEKLVIALGE